MSMLGMPRLWLRDASLSTTREFVYTAPVERMFANGIAFSKIGGGGYGQNLAMWGSSENPEAFGATASVARAASNGWYNGELNDFPSSDYGKDSPNMANFEKWGHFSQLVWAETKKVGCATHFCEPGTMSGLGSWYTVCNYYPAGMLSSQAHHDEPH
jgi:hypothetical protein